MAKLIWSPQAIDDLDAICSYIERDSYEYARLFAIHFSTSKTCSLFCLRFGRGVYRPVVESFMVR